MTTRKRHPAISPGTLYTVTGMVDDEAEIRAGMLGSDVAITGRSIVLEKSVLNRARMIGEARGLRVVECRAETIDCANSIFDESSWRDVLVAESRCTGARFNFSHLAKVTFDQCQMSHAQFQESKLTHVHFDTCDLRGSFFNGAQMQGTVFAGSNLTGADFSRADITKCDFRRAIIEDIRIAPDQLTGVIVTQDQALYLARLLGLDVRE